MGTKYLVWRECGDQWFLLAAVLPWSALWRPTNLPGVRRLCSGCIFQIQRASNESHSASSTCAGESKREKLDRAEECSCQSCAWKMRKIRSGRRKPCLGWCSCAKRSIKDNLYWRLILSLIVFTSCYLVLHWGKKKSLNLAVKSTSSRSMPQHRLLAGCHQGFKLIGPDPESLLSVNQARVPCKLNIHIVLMYSQNI